VALVSEEEESAEDELLTLLGRYPEGASVVTVDAAGRRFGLTIGSLVSLSLDPPLIGFALPTDEALCEVLPIAGGCAISILAGGQTWLADHFATSERPIAMWHALAAEPGAAGAPLFVGALGWLECSLLESVELGSHTLFVCHVRELEPSTDAPALMRVHGNYGVV
jgi:flavin reductase (DIM6/NTAB) family NADH-FMN oxidoreductase RutF